MHELFVHISSLLKPDGDNAKELKWMLYTQFCVTAEEPPNIGNPNLYYMAVIKHV